MIKKTRRVRKSVYMKAPTKLEVFDSVWWKARGRVFQEHEYGRAWRYMNHLKID